MTSPSDIERILRGWGGRPTVAIVNLDQLAANVRVLRGMIGEHTKLMSVVKADGYGHGSIPVARTALATGADELGVATVEEGIRLRHAGIEAPILVLGPIGAKERRRAIAHDLMLVVGEPSFAKALAADVRKSGRKGPVKVHLKIDTGMHRFGVSPDEAADLARVVDGLRELRIDGVMTHLACADSPDPSATERQASVFDRALAAIQKAGVEVRGLHLTNSPGTINFPRLHRDRVRIGTAMYGLKPDPGMELPEALRPVMTVHSRISRILDLQPGDRVSYGGTWTAEEPARVGLVAIGYGDGYDRTGSNRAWMEVRGTRAPVRGRVCMDQTLIGVPDDARPDDLVTVISDGRNGVAPGIDQLAEMYGTISYEIACGLVAPRLAHLYVKDARLVAITDLWGYRELDEDALRVNDAGRELAPAR
jgi:alanine racemase